MTDQHHTTFDGILLSLEDKAEASEYPDFRPEIEAFVALQPEIDASRPKSRDPETGAGEPTEGSEGE